MSGRIDGLANPVRRGIEEGTIGNLQAAVQKVAECRLVHSDVLSRFRIEAEQICAQIHKFP